MKKDWPVVYVDGLICDDVNAAAHNQRLLEEAADALIKEHGRGTIKLRVPAGAKVYFDTGADHDKGSGSKKVPSR